MPVLSLFPNARGLDWRLLSRLCYWFGQHRIGLGRRNRGCIRPEPKPKE